MNTLKGYKFNKEQDYVSTFDVIAILLGVIKEMSLPCFTRQESIEALVDPEGMVSILDAIEENISSDAKSNTIDVGTLLAERGIPKAAIEVIDRSFDFTNDIKGAFLLINKLSDLMGQAILSEYQRFSSPFVCLNSNFSDTGILILPRFKALYDPEDAEVELSAEDRTKKLKWAEERHHLVFSHFYIVDSENLQLGETKFNIINHVINPELYRKKIDDPFVIVISPLTCEKVIDVEYKEDESERIAGQRQRVFEINGLVNADALHEKIKVVFQKASEQKADLLVFPEMLGDEVSTNNVFWKELYDDAENNDNIGPAFISTPTWWHDNSNEGYLFDNGAKEIFHYQKQIPYSGKNPESEIDEIYTENLKKIDRTIHILHISGIGRVIFTICRDFLQNDFVDILLRELGATFLIVPSYSAGTTQFKNAWLGGVQYGCYGIWVNACSAKDSEGKTCVGLLTSPIRDAKGNNQIEIVPDCKLVCQNSGTTCAIKIELNQSEFPKIEMI